MSAPTAAGGSTVADEAIVDRLLNAISEDRLRAAARAVTEIPSPTGREAPLARFLAAVSRLNVWLSRPPSTSTSTRPTPSAGCAAVVAART